MKNISLLLNVILIAAVAFLYYKIYNPKEQTFVSSQTLPESGIVFVNSDSLLNHYNYFNELKAVMEKKQDSIDNLLKSKAQQLESEIQQYQKQAIGMTDMEKQQIEERLMQKQQALVDFKQQLLGHLSEEEEALNENIHSNLIGYLKEFNKIKNYSYILGYQKGGGILLANDSFDITNAVIEGLNRK